MKNKKQDLFIEIASANKFVGYYKGCKVYSNPFVPEDVLFFVNDDNFKLDATNKLFKTRKLPAKTT